MNLALELIEECGVLLAEAEMECGHKHQKVFAKLSELRDRLRVDAVQQAQYCQEGLDTVGAQRLSELMGKLGAMGDSEEWGEKP